MLELLPYNGLTPPTRAKTTPAFDLLIERNRTATPYPRNATIPQLFEAWARATPDAVALAFEDRTLTYGQLDRKSNQLARHLQGLGVGPEVIVAVSIDRSPEMIVALLGILKAGGAYLPLDPDAPPARLQFILGDAAAHVILAHSHRAALLPDHSAHVVRIDQDWPQIDHESQESLPGDIGASNLAYVLFTSGSTGTPKGVIVEHRAVVRLVCNTDYARLDADEVFLQMAPLAFDASTFEIWGALLNGAKLAIMPPCPPSPAEIGKAISEHGVTTLWLTAGLFHQMVEVSLESLRGVRQLLAGGDIVAVPHARKLLNALPDCQLINGYGPTECTTFSCCCPVDAAALAGTSIPIGRPIANTRAYILDATGAPAGIGVQGELYIGGDGLARGYLNRPELTAERFLPDPFSKTGSMYRSGDLARYLPDGRIEFLGRADNQVKIRGFRIELDEIAAALLEHPSVSACAVVAEGECAGDKRLAAYISVRHLSPTSIELREFLKGRLPEYMVPALFWRLNAMPLTANGKVDYAALPSCGKERLPSGVAYAAPGSGMEQMVAGVWQEVLAVEQVGLHENFFDIGGDSLRLTQMHGKLQQAAGVQFAVTALFQHPTVASFARYLAEQSAPTGAGQQTAARAGAAIAEDRAARQKAAMARWKPAAKGDQKVA